jgi:hypothetical protein
VSSEYDNVPEGYKCAKELCCPGEPCVCVSFESLNGRGPAFGIFKKCTPISSEEPIEDSPAENGNNLGTTTTPIENEEKSTNIDFDKCDNCCSGDESFLELVKKVSLLEAEISKLRLELDEIKENNSESGIDSESKKERSGITGFFAKIFG